MVFDRRFHWLSSGDESNSEVLNDLHKKMISFYSELNKRQSYQELLDEVDNDLANPGQATLAFLDYLQKSENKDLLEVGCGNARIYKNIKRLSKSFNYLGIEVSEDVILKNKQNYPEANWIMAGVYNIPLEDNSVDICFSFYVLEHLVFPEKALKEMLRVIRPNGKLVIIFPDFKSSLRFASQRIGLSHLKTAKEKLSKGYILDSLISLYDSRIRLPYHLKNSKTIYGSFAINIQPKCLDPLLPEISPDVDAVYIASKEEITEWAINKGFKVDFPAGKNGYFNEHAFISIEKSLK